VTQVKFAYGNLDTYVGLIIGYKRKGMPYVLHVVTRVIVQWPTSFFELFLLDIDWILIRRIDAQTFDYAMVLGLIYRVCECVVEHIQYD